MKHPAIGGGSAPAIPPVVSPPGIPVKPAPQAKNSAWAEFYDKLARYLLQGLKSELKMCGVDISQHGELHHVPPTNIEKNTEPAVGGAQLTTFRETWNIERCVAALESTGRYEAAGSLWWFQLLSGGKVVFQGQSVFDTEPDRAAVEAAAVLWDEAAFRASDLIEHRRRYDFPGVFPTACVGLPDARVGLPDATAVGLKAGQETPTFKDVPLVAGRQVVLAFLEAMAYCMASNLQKDKERLVKLFEVLGTCIDWGIRPLS